jgi:hypothetical protein
MTTSRLQEYAVTLSVLLFAHDEEEALEITRDIKAAIERSEIQGSGRGRSIRGGVR